MTRHAHAAVFVLIASLVGVYDLWAVRATGHPFLWGRDLPGYYDYLGRAFAAGRLSLPIQPTPQLLALRDPWDPTAGVPYKMHDMAFRNGRYYLYHGATPAALLFAPWRLLTRHDLPENFALFLFCFAGFLFSSGALLAMLRLTAVRPAPALLGLLFLALGICQGAPYLMSRVWVYEIAIGGAYFCVSAAVFFLLRGVESEYRARWWAASGLMFGLAIGCRPHMIFAAGIALVLTALFLGRRRIAELIAFAAPLALIGVLLAAYNYARFGSPFEFGIRYLLSGANQNRIHLAAAYLPPGLYYFLFSAPDFNAVFPWVRLFFRYPPTSPTSLPPGYFVEPANGALFLAPFLVAALFVPRGKARLWSWILTASSLSLVIFLASAGFTTQRYAVDFLPLAILAALANLAIHLDRARGPKRALLAAAIVGSIAFGVIVNLALGIAGPYDEILKNRPQTYARIAAWFSPLPQFRPVLNPKVTREFTVQFAPLPEGAREPLLTMGRQTWRHFLYVRQVPTGLHLVSQADDSVVSRPLPDPGRTPHPFRVSYAAGLLTVAVDDQPVLTHQMGPLFTAPFQITLGENRIDPFVTAPRFSGRMASY